MLSDEETFRLIRAAKEGDAGAKEALLSANVSLLKSIVRRYLGKGVEFDDLFQLAGMGLLKAIAGFDERSVSYTHLDVYKRQAWRTRGW